MIDDFLLFRVGLDEHLRHFLGNVSNLNLNRCTWLVSEFERFVGNSGFQSTRSRLRVDARI